MRDTPATVGILGGMSSESTVEYYRLLDDHVNDALGGHSGANLLIRSVDFADVERFIRTDDWEQAGEYLADAARQLETGGAALVVMATNTMHRVAPAIVEALSIPFVHIVDATAEAISAAGVETVGLLGTRTTMEASFYRDRLAAHGIETVVPNPAEREAVDAIIFEELTNGAVREESRRRYLSVIDSLADAGAEGIVLGCTEIELLVDDGDRPDLPLFDTTAIHARRAAQYSLGERDLDRVGGP